MKKILSTSTFVIAVILALVLFAGCGSSFKSYLPTKERVNPALDIKFDIVLGENEEISPVDIRYNPLNYEALVKEKILIIHNTANDRYHLYDLEKQSAVSSNSYTKIEYFTNGIFLAEKGDSNSKCGLLSADGEELTSFEFFYDGISNVDFEKSADGNIIRVSYVYYKVENNRTITRIGDIRNLSFGIDPTDVKHLHLCGDFLYAYEGDVSKGVSSLKAYTIWGALINSFGNEGTGTEYFILNGGNVLIKNDLIVPSDSNDYTYIDDLGNKCSIRYEIYNLKRESFQDYKFDYYIEEIGCYDNLSGEEKEYFSKSVLKSNKSVIYEIKEERLIKTDFYKKGLIVSNSLEVKADIGLFDIYKLGNNRFLFISLLDNQNSFIKDRKGNYIEVLGANYMVGSSGSIDSASGSLLSDPTETRHSGSIVILYNKVTKRFGAINKDGEEIVDFKYNSLSLFYGGKAIGTISGGTDAGSYIISEDKSVKEIDDNPWRINMGIFYQTDSKEVYSPNGTRLFLYEGVSAYPIKLYDGTYFFECDGNIYYYVK